MHGFIFHTFLFSIFERKGIGAQNYCPPLSINCVYKDTVIGGSRIHDAQSSGQLHNSVAMVMLSKDFHHKPITNLTEITSGICSNNRPVQARLISLCYSGKWSHSQC